MPRRCDDDDDDDAYRYGYNERAYDERAYDNYRRHHHARECENRTSARLVLPSFTRMQVLLQYYANGEMEHDAPLTQLAPVHDTLDQQRYEDDFYPWYYGGYWPPAYHSYYGGQSYGGSDYYYGRPSQSAECAACACCACVDSGCLPSTTWQSSQDATSSLEVIVIVVVLAVVCAYLYSNVTLLILVLRDRRSCRRWCREPHADATLAARAIRLLDVYVANRTWALVNELILLASAIALIVVCLLPSASWTYAWVLLVALFGVGLLSSLARAMAWNFGRTRVRELNRLRAEANAEALLPSARTAAGGVRDRDQMD